MKAMVLYDSTYGNTKSIAENIARELEEVGATAVPVTRFDPDQLSAGDLLVVGSPINGWRPTTKISSAINVLSRERLRGVKAAAFDTRVRLFIHGDAGRKISHALKSHGAEIIASPQAFYVQGTEGPLRPGETAKAAAWARTLLERIGK